MQQVALRLFVALVCLGGGIAYAQGGVTSSLSGTVVDTSGAVIPGADVSVKNNATAGVSTAVTAENGTFSIPALQPGTYTATVSLMGFKTAVLNDVIVNAGTPASVRVTLEVGTLAETVQVRAASEIVQTQTSMVSATLDTNQILNLPLQSRAALNSVAGLAGVNTPGDVRDSTVNGLPQSTINITLDGMNIQDNWLKTTDGFFARLNPSVDAVEEVTVTTAANGADSAGQGAVNIRMVTRFGTNELRGSGYYYHRNDFLNANTWFNNRDLAPDPKTGKAPKTELLQHQPGFRIGGPISIPGLFSGRNKAFFFVNYEESRSPRKITYNRNILHPAGERGIFRYNTSAGVREVNLLDLAARNGHISSIDPTVATLFADIRSSTSQGSLSDVTDPALQQFTFQNPATNFTPSPTIRVDYNATANHRLTGSFNYQHINARPDTTNSREPRFPGFPHTGSQQSTRWTTSEAVRSTLGSRLVNEVRFGGTGGPTQFFPEMGNTMWSNSVGHTDGFQLGINSSALPLANAASTTGNSTREAFTRVVEDTLSWVKGSHGISAGASFLQAEFFFESKTHVPTIDFGIASGDPADAMFNTANLPGASTTQLDAARELYAILVGRVNAIQGNARLNESTNEYEYLGLGTERGRMRELGFFVQDSWRARRNLTINAGLRYEMQLPFYALNNSYYTATVADVWGVSGVGNLFKPGTLTGQKPVFGTYAEGTRAFNTDRNNFAPSIGIAWTPGSRGSLLGKIIGDEGDTVLRGGYALAYNRPGMSSFRGIFSENPGVTLTADRDTSQGTLGPVPLLFRERARLGPPPFPRTQVVPFTEVITGDVNIFDPDLQVPYSQTWTAGWQRKLSRDMAVDVRYVGTRHLQQWQTFNFNEPNIVDNGFLNEFRAAQANLQTNIAAGRGSTFRYFGPGTGTSPLPIYLGYFSGVPASQAGDAARYTSTSFSSPNFVNPLARFRPDPFVPAGTNSNSGLDGNPTRRANAVAAGLPRNFFRVNPDLLGGADITGNGGYTRYHSLQIDLKKRLSHGLQFQTSYVWGRALATNWYGFRKDYRESLDAGDEGGVTHALKGTWVYELPFGQGRKFLSNAGGLLDRLVGGWSFDGLARIQSGRIVDFGNVRLVGMSLKDLRRSIKLQEYAATGLNPNARTLLYILPKDILENTVRAFDTSATSLTGYGSQGPPSGRYLAPANGPDCIETSRSDFDDATTGYGDCAPHAVEVTGPMYVRFDLSAVKKVRINGRFDIQFRAEMLNAFNHPNFEPVLFGSSNNFANGPSNANNYRITSVQENSSRQVQLVTRLSW